MLVVSYVHVNVFFSFIVVFVSYLSLQSDMLKYFWCVLICIFTQLLLPIANDLSWYHG